MQDDSTTLPQDIQQQLDELTQQAKDVSRDVEETNQQTNARLDEIHGQVKESVGAIKERLAKLDEADKKAGDELDTLALDYAEKTANPPIDLDTDDEDAE